MINKHQPHVVIWIEDDANRNIVNGFLNAFEVDQKQAKSLSRKQQNGKAGWQKTAVEFINHCNHELSKLPYRFMLLIIDFDADDSRRNWISQRISNSVRDRVFIIGVWQEPEDLKRSVRLSFETIGAQLAQECANNQHNLWQHPLLTHNQSELTRLTTAVKPFLFN